ncbi:MAG: aromatic-ring-hydroxylating dioxygenase subunit beta [Aeromicrobium erythreum]
MTATTPTRPSPDAPALGPVPDGWDVRDVEQFLYREARLADENDYDGWEALWTDDAIYWVPADDLTADPTKHVSVIYDNRSRISTRMKQVRTGKRYAQAPPSNLRRIIGNVELLGGRPNPEGGTDLEVGANVMVLESRQRTTQLWGGRTTYRLRREGDTIRLAYKQVVLVDHDKVIPTLGFLL